MFDDMSDLADALAALLALSGAFGDVLTTVAVSLRSTACWFALAAACGVTPMFVVVGLVATLGMVLVFGIVVLPPIPPVCAEAIKLHVVSTFVTNNLHTIDFFMMKVSPVRLKNSPIFQLSAVCVANKTLIGERYILKASSSPLRDSMRRINVGLIPEI